MTIISLLDAECSSNTSWAVDVRTLGATRVRTAVPRLLKELRQRPVDAVMTTLKHVSITLALCQPWLPRGTRHVARVANTYSEELAATPAASAFAQRQLIRASHRWVSHVVCVSSGVRADLVQKFKVPGDRCTVVPNPVDVDWIEDQSRLPPPALHQPIQAAKTRFLSVARLEPQKDHATLLRAFARVAKELDAALIVAGEGSLRTELEALAVNLGVSDRVQFLGYVTNPYPLMSVSDALVLSSRYEGLPNVLLEALALGVPCVSTNCAHGPAEILKDRRLGVLVPVGDDRALSMAMASTAQSNAGSEARSAYIRTHYSPEAAAYSYREALLPSSRSR